VPERIRRVSGGGPYEDVTGYSRAVVVDGRVLVAGSTSAVDGEVLHAGDARAQALEAFGVVRRALERAGTDLRHVVRTRMYVVGREHCDAVASAHREVMGEVRPAATMVCVAALVHPDMLVEVEAEAVLP
jgi:enamine deaminase RidA (YjgF/YER057c/UK114 family)